MTHEALSETLLRACICIYDALNDDDEDVRICATEVCRAVMYEAEQFPKGRMSCVSQVESSMLLRYLAGRGRYSVKLCAELICRLTGARVNSLSSSGSFESRVKQIEANKYNLFAVEKPNIFIEAPIEIIAWSRLLQHMHYSMIKNSFIRKLENWVFAGSRFIMQRIAKDECGPFDWTSDTDIYVLGSRLFCTAELLLKWHVKNQSAPVSSSCLFSTLWELLVLGQRRKLHPGWLNTVDRILEDSIRERLQHAHVKLSRLSTALISHAEG